MQSSQSFAVPLTTEARQYLSQSSLGKFASVSANSRLVQFVQHAHLSVKHATSCAHLSGSVMALTVKFTSGPMGYGVEPHFVPTSSDQLYIKRSVITS